LCSLASIPSLESPHPGCSVNTSQEQHSQEHAYNNSLKTRDEPKKDVVEEKEERHDGEKPPARKEKNLS